MSDLVAFPIPTVQFTHYGFGRVVYVSDWPNLPTAVTALLLANVEATLVIDIPVTISSDLNVNSPITLAQVNAGAITVAANKTLYVERRPRCGNQQLFVQAASTSNVTFGPEVGFINIAWFTGPTPTLCTNAINQACTSISNNSGGGIYIPAGTGWTTAGGHFWHSNMIVEGDGRETTTLTLTTNAVMWTVGENTYFMSPRDMTFDGGGNGGTWTKAVGSNPNTSANFTPQSIRVINFAKQLDIASVDNEWQFSGIVYDAGCDLRSNNLTWACNTGNTDIRHDGYTWVEDGDQIATFSQVGPTQWYGEFAGQGTYGHNQVESQPIVGTAGGTFTAQSVVTAAGMGGSPITVDVPLVVGDSNASLVATKFRTYLGNDPNVSSFFHIGGTGATVQLIALDPAANDATMNFSIVAGGSSVTPSATSTNTTAGTTGSRAHGFVFSGAHGPVSFRSMRAEGFDYLLDNTANDLNSNISFDGCVIQGAVKLSQGATVATNGCSIFDRTFRQGAAPSIYNGAGSDVIPELSNFAGTGVVTLSTRQPTNFSTIGITGLQVDNANLSIFSQFAMTILRTAYNNGMLALLASSDFVSPLLRIGSAVGRIAGAYYDFWREHTGTVTVPIGYLIIQGNQGDPFTGIYHNGQFLGQGFLGDSPTAGVGHRAGSGGVVTQITSKSTGVTLNTINGAITMINSSLADSTTVTFTVTNSTIGANDNPTARYKSGAAGSGADYLIWAHTPAAGSFKISVRNISGGALTDALVIGFENKPGAIT